MKTRKKLTDVRESAYRASSYQDKKWLLDVFVEETGVFCQAKFPNFITHTSQNNLFVPVPAFDDIEVYNRQLLELLGTKAEELHYKKLLPIKDLLEADRAALMAMQRSLDSCPGLRRKLEKSG
jgi:hypothetical protein